MWNPSIDATKYVEKHIETKQKNQKYIRDSMEIYVESKNRCYEICRKTHKKQKQKSQNYIRDSMEIMTVEPYITFT